MTVHGLTELRLSVPEAGKRLLPLPVAVWHKDVAGELGASPSPETESAFLEILRGNE